MRKITMTTPSKLAYVNATTYIIPIPLLATGMKVKVEFGFAPGEEEAGRTKQNVFPFVLCVHSFSFVWRTGGKGIREPC